MSDEPKMPADICEEESSFEVRGKPTIDLTVLLNTNSEHDKVLLKQKLEEDKYRESKKTRIIATTVGAEFKPENMPYIPGSTHPALLKHDLATIERNAGYQDRSLVPKMYAEQLKPREVPVDLTPADITDAESDIGSLIAQFGRLEPTQLSQPPSPVPTIFQPVEQGKPAEFTMKVSREKMHHGGIYFANESRPYRPGD
jgi:hypothetical protein